MKNSLPRSRPSARAQTSQHTVPHEEHLNATGLVTSIVMSPPVTFARIASYIEKTDVPQTEHVPNILCLVSLLLGIRQYPLSFAMAGENPYHPSITPNALFLFTCAHSSADAISSIHTRILDHREGPKNFRVLFAPPK